MNRSTVVAVVATAAIGLAGGAVTAVVRGDEERTPPAAGSSATAKPAAATGVVLYVGDGTIVDGDRSVRIDGAPDGIGQLGRVDGGWLVSAAHPDSPTEPASQVLFVTPDGRSRQVRRRDRLVRRQRGG